MKYILVEQHRNIGDDELIADLREVAAKIEQNTLSSGSMKNLENTDFKPLSIDLVRGTMPCKRLV